MHQSVLLEEALEGLKIKKNGIYIDGTFGRGGHSAAILEQLDKEGQLIAIDKDEEAIAHAQAVFGDDKRLTMVHDTFAHMDTIARARGVLGKTDGILLDLGVSSPQLDTPERGFSFMQAGPLDMRMNQSQVYHAGVFINHASALEMETVFKTFGEERFAKRIAKAIVEERKHAPIDTTQRLAEIVKVAHPAWEKHKHPATRVFQALRIHVNQELQELEHVLKASLSILKVGGRLVVISFHSLEDRIVKQFMKREEEGEPIPRGVPIRINDQLKSFKRIGKAIKPSQKEIDRNVRSRSAVLRIGEKLA